MTERDTIKAGEAAVSWLQKRLNERNTENGRLRAALQRIADDDVETDLKGNASVLSGIAWAALNPEQIARSAIERVEP